VNPYGAVTLRTQFAPGYSYDTKPERVVSRFFDPAYVTQSAGMEYKPVPEFSTRVVRRFARCHIAVQPVRYRSDNEHGAQVWTRGGLESVSELNANVAENIQFVGRLELFARSRVSTVSSCGMITRSCKRSTNTSRPV